MDIIFLIGRVLPFFGVIVCIWYTRRAIKKGYIITEPNYIGEKHVINCRKKDPESFRWALILNNVTIMILSCIILILEILAKV